MGGIYKQKSIRERLLALFLDNVGVVIIREQILEAAKDPKTGLEPENWHQRLSELRTDYGYDIHSWRDRKALKPGEYLMVSATPTRKAKIRKSIPKEIKDLVLKRASNKCEWDGCALNEGDNDPVSGATVKLQVDHIDPHSSLGEDDLCNYQALCPRHQVVKKNFYSGKNNVPNLLELVRNAGEKDKLSIYTFLKNYFDESKD